MAWFVKHYTGEDWPVIKSDAGVILEVCGGTRGLADDIAARLNSVGMPEGPVTVTTREGDIEVTVTGPSMEVVERMLASMDASGQHMDGGERVEIGGLSRPLAAEQDGHAALLEVALDQQKLRTEEVSKERDTWKEAALTRSAAIDELRAALAGRDQVIEGLRHERDQWVHDASFHAGNTNYYRDIVDRCGRALGPEAFTCDDGSHSEEPLRAKVAELVEKLVAERVSASHRDIAGALFDFCGMLTGGDEVYTFSARHWATPAIDALRKFAEKRGLDLNSADVAFWHHRLPCPICKGIGGCDHTYPERARKEAKQ